MKDTGDECVTDTIRYQHHAMPVPVITATNRILEVEATWRLTNTINGVQEAPPDEMVAIHNLCALLLGKVPLQEPEPLPQSCRPTESLTVSPKAEPEHDNAPILMWDLTADKTPAVRKSCPLARLPTSLAPTAIKDIIDGFDAPPTPIVVRPTAHG
jgi:hypothetical protein